MKITLAFKKKSSDGLSGKLLEKVIKTYTRSDYFHVEMIIGNRWISTNPSVGAVYINELRELNDNYDYVELNVNGKKLKKVLNFLEAQVGKKYDYYGLFFSIILKTNLDDKERWFCSEIIAEALKIFGENLLLSSNRYTPGDLANIYIKLTKKVI